MRQPLPTIHEDTLFGSGPHSLSETLQPGTITAIHVQSCGGQKYYLYSPNEEIVGLAGKRELLHASAYLGM